MRSFLAPPGDPTPTEPPMFAVVIAAYQAAPFVGEAIESALAQTRPAREILVCDDGSTDDLEGALKPYDRHVTLLRLPHRGAGAARNAGARAASADFVAALDADDAFLPERLEALGELAAARPDLDILASDAELESAGRAVGRFYGSNAFDVDDQRSAILRGNFILGNAAVRRTALLAAGGFDEALATGEDWSLWLRLLLGGSSAGLVDEPLARYRLRPRSLTADRVAALRGRAGAIAPFVHDPRLSPGERAIARSTLRSLELRLLMAEAAAALRGELPGRRRRLLAIARHGGFGRRTRARAGAAAVLPPLVGARLERELAAAEHASRTPLEAPGT